LRQLIRQNIPDHVAESLWLHDAALLSIKKSGKNYVMLVRRDGFWPDDPTPYRKVVYRCHGISLRFAKSYFKVS
jgi:hypothetical protein